MTKFSTTMPRTSRQYSDTGIYHVMMRGIDRRDIFVDDQDRRKFLKVLRAVAFPEDRDGKPLPPYCNIHAYCLMDNHIHLLLLGVLSDCLTYVDTVLHRLSLQLKTGICQANHMEITPIKGVIHLRNEICYIHRNPYKARIASPQSYPWSSACLYFCPFFEKGEPIGNLGKRDQRALFHTGLTIKPDLMHRDGLILPTSFVSLTLGQKAFDNSVQYFDILRRYNLEAEVAENHGVHESITFSDKEMEQKISIILQNEYHVKDLHQLDRKELLMLARKLSSRFGVREKQLVRLLGLESSILQKIL